MVFDRDTVLRVTGWRLPILASEVINLAEWPVPGSIHGYSDVLYVISA